MKPKRLNKKLSFNKQTIAKLNVEEQKHLKGGVDNSDSYCTGITCEICDSDISCEVRKCDWCYTEYPGCLP